jgi:hypothetical protein
MDIEDTWRRQGLDVQRKTYDVLVSYPNFTDPSRVEMVDGTGAVLYQSAAMEKILLPEQNASDMIPPFNAYSRPGNLTVIAGLTIVILTMLCNIFKQIHSSDSLMNLGIASRLVCVSVTYVDHVKTVHR